MFFLKVGAKSIPIACHVVEGYMQYSIIFGQPLSDGGYLLCKEWLLQVFV